MPERPVEPDERHNGASQLMGRAAPGGQRGQDTRRPLDPGRRCLPRLKVELQYHPPLPIDDLYLRLQYYSVSFVGPFFALRP